MPKPRSALLAASSIVLAVAVTGCAMGSGQRSHFGGLAENSNIGVALRAQVALQQGDVVSAISFAERAVEKSPTDAAFRSLLGNAYLAAGRFRSAEAAFADALAIYPNQAGIPLKLALAQAAQGRGDVAAQTLETYAELISAADSGLAMALAGRPGAAIETLELAARSADADARVRQNLALAYALAGDWTRARQVATQDLAGDQLEQRMSEWATFSQPGAASAQVAALIGVKAPAQVDNGMPVRLALRAPDKSQAIRSADAAPVAPVLASAESVSAAVPAAPFAEPTQVDVAAVVAPATASSFAPDVAAMLDSLRAEKVRPQGGLPKVAELRRAAARRFGSSRAVVQLGAYATEAGVKSAWSQIARRHRHVAGYVPASARFAGSRGTVYRLSLKGFASDGDARRLCMQLKNSGATCFVRNAAGDTPVRFASR